MSNNINISITSFIKDVCKFCGSKPKIYYYVHDPHTWHDIQQLMTFNNHIKSSYTRFNFDDYLELNPAETRNTSKLKHCPNYKSYNPKQHKNKENSIYSFTEYTEYLACECGESKWAFKIYSARSKPEIFNKKGKYTYSHKTKFKGIK